MDFRDYSARNMERLELAYKECDLLYAFFRKFGYIQYLEPTMRFKDQIASTIIIILKKENYSRKTCRRCGRPLSFLSVSSLCDRCFERMRSSGPHSADVSDRSRSRGRSGRRERAAVQ